MPRTTALRLLAASVGAQLAWLLAPRGLGCPPALDIGLALVAGVLVVGIARHRPAAYFAAAGLVAWAAASAPVIAPSLMAAAPVTALALLQLLLLAVALRPDGVALLERPTRDDALPR